VSLKVFIERVCQVEKIRFESVEGGGRRAELCRVREGIAYLWVEREAIKRRINGVLDSLLGYLNPRIPFGHSN